MKWCNLEGVLNQKGVKEGLDVFFCVILLSVTSEFCHIRNAVICDHCNRLLFHIAFLSV